MTAAQLLKKSEVKRRRYAFKVRVISDSGCFSYVFSAYTLEEARALAAAKNPDADCYVGWVLS